MGSEGRGGKGGDGKGGEMMGAEGRGEEKREGECMGGERGRPLTQIPGSAPGFGGLTFSTLTI